MSRMHNASLNWDSKGSQCVNCVWTWRLEFSSSTVSSFFHLFQMLQDKNSDISLMWVAAASNYIFSIIFLNHCCDKILKCLIVIQKKTNMLLELRLQCPSLSNECQNYNKLMVYTENCCDFLKTFFLFFLFLYCNSCSRWQVWQIYLPQAFEGFPIEYKPQCTIIYLQYKIFLVLQKSSLLFFCSQRKDF